MSGKKIKQENAVAETSKKEGLEIPKTKWQCEQFLNHCKITLDLVQESKTEWNELAAIHDDHICRIESLNDTARYIVERLQKSENVHSVRSRVKNAGGLVRKVIRKRKDSSRDISFGNYRQEITDLIGCRALHLYKEDWLAIHEFILEEWGTIETPTAYIRAGDKSEWVESYKQNGCQVKDHPRNYRSVHYLIQCSGSRTPIIAELQVRTLFEEAWSEIDHRINYPIAANHNLIAYYLELFNRYAGSADEMGSFLPILVSELKKFDLETERANTERDEALKKVEELIKKSKMDASEKEQLRDELRNVRATLPTKRPDMYSTFMSNRDDASSIALSMAGRAFNDLCKTCRKPIDPIIGGRIGDKCISCAYKIG